MCTSLDFSVSGADLLVSPCRTKCQGLGDFQRNQFVICAFRTLLTILPSPHVTVHDVTDDSPSSRSEASPEHRCDHSAVSKALSELACRDGSVAGPSLLICSKSEA